MIEMHTGARPFQKSQSTSGAFTIFKAHERSIMADPAASERVDVNHGKGYAFKTFLL